MIDSIKRRMSIVRAKFGNDEYVKHVSWSDVEHEVFKRYGRLKVHLRRSMKVVLAAEMSQVEIDGRVICWPAEADVDRLIDMYFEVFNENNNHYFDIPEMKIKAGDVVIDCGACEGYFTLKALESGAAKVYCIEPGEAITRCLHRSFASAVEAGKVHIHSCLIGATNREVGFHDDPSDPTVCQVSDKADGGECFKKMQMLTLDEFCSQYLIDRVDFVKVDVEGGEVGLVYGAENTIRNFRPNLAIAVYHAPENANLIVDFIEKLSLGYKVKVKGIVDFNGIPRPVMVHCFRSR